MLRLFCCTALLLTVGAMAQDPFPRAGDKCPGGTYRSGDYCKPYASATGKDQAVITKSGKDCPSGFYSSGNYCKQYPGAAGRDAIPREQGANCPSGWYRSGKYCVKHSQ